VRPRLLDLFCGAGGAAVGYHQAGFDVVGVDIAPQPRYPFSFIHADALEYLNGQNHSGIQAWDAIHASPPCQAYTTMANRHGRSEYAVIDRTRELLLEAGLPYVIENVRGALRHMRNPAELTGEMFHLGVHRPRLFETNWLLLTHPPATRQLDPVAVYGKNDQRLLWKRADGTELHAATLEDAQAAMGIDWMGWDEIKEAIPPAYTELIGHQLLQHIQVAA
jgi:DNA (cytosine-5)-methyltransferase 1